jgi:hypothetical protein
VLCGVSELLRPGSTRYIQHAYNDVYNYKKYIFRLINIKAENAEDK